MKYKVILYIIFSFAAWFKPIQAVSAHEIAEPELTAQFINYEQYHKKPEKNKVVVTKPVEKSKRTSTPLPENGIQSRWHSTKAEKTISTEVLRAYLEGIKSPLAPYSTQILESPHWSTIIGICTIEQYNCTHAPGNNYWGLMCPGKGLCKYATLADGITAISARLVKYDVNGHDTIEKLNGYYVYPASSNWYNTVIKIKTHLESL